MRSFKIDDFSKILKNTIEKDIKKVDQTLRKWIFETFAQIQLNTPVLTGMLRSDWNIETIHRSAFNTWYYINTMPYAERIEFEGWSSTKAPDGMVRISLDSQMTVLQNIIKQMDLK